jgi:hypothetical protein
MITRPNVVNSRGKIILLKGIDVGSIPTNPTNKPDALTRLSLGSSPRWTTI